MVVQQARSGATDNANRTKQPRHLPPGSHHNKSDSPAVNIDKGTLRTRKLQYTTQIGWQNIPQEHTKAGAGKIIEEVM